MIITFVSAFLNHHQLLLCEELKKHCDEFYYISTKPVPVERISLGYEDIEKKYDYVLRTYDGSSAHREIEKLILRSDAVIFGECDDRYIELRMKENKLSFLYSERFFKKGTWRRFIPSARKKIERRTTQHKNKNFYVLCASAFLSYDLSLLGFDSHKCFKWGYFPEVKDYDVCPQRNNSVPSILWAGRMIDWKHPEHAVEVAKYLKEKGCDFVLDMIGTGESEAVIKEKIKASGLEDRVNVLGSMSPQKVNEYMEKADIFMMTSSKQEGWGAVVNEAMSTGCVVLGSSAAGSVPFLIKDEENGLIYKYGNMSDLFKKAEMLVNNPDLRKELSENAYKTIKCEYNQVVAVERLMEFINNDCKLSRSFESGPLSAAPVMKNNWYKV